MSYRARRRATECDAALSQEPSSGPCITITIISTITITITITITSSNSNYSDY